MTESFGLFLRAWDSLTRHLDSIVKERILNQRREIEQIIQHLLTIKNQKRGLILVGVGRCSSILQMFMTRLLQDPLRLPREQVKIVSEGPFEPVITPGAFVICLSGSGVTMPTVSYADRYVKMGAKLILVTSNRKGPLVRIAETYVIIPGLEKQDIQKPKYAYGPDQPVYFKDFHPGPTLFECGALVLFDSMISTIQKNLSAKTT